MPCRPLRPNTRTLILLFLLWTGAKPMQGWGQEFPKGFVGYLEFHQGLSTNFQGSPDLFVSELQFRPQVTVIDSILRLGATAGLLYTNTQVDGLFGPSLALKIAQFGVQEFGTIANIQLQADYYWSTRGRSFLGGGPKIEIGKLLMLGLTAHRDLKDNVWFFQSTLGFNLFHTKPPNNNQRPPDPFHHNN